MDVSRKMDHAQAMHKVFSAGCGYGAGGSLLFNDEMSNPVGSL